MCQLLIKTMRMIPPLSDAVHAVIREQLKTAKNEMTLHDQFDYLIHSETKDADYNELMNIYRKHSKLLEL